MGSNFFRDFEENQMRSREFIHFVNILLETAAPFFLATHFSARRIDQNKNPNNAHKVAEIHARKPFPKPSKMKKKYIYIYIFFL